ncbi:MAG: preprotein translocase subunit SecA [Caldiserica bacterium]|nr:preprotein translocase subunit SecA [Caldisericota bacterium]
MLLDIFDPVKRNLKKYWEIVNVVNSFEEQISKLSDFELKTKTVEFKERLSKGEEDQSILPETFAVVREVAKRTVNMRPFDVQILGAIVLYNGGIAEMKTGEGKTLVATMPLYLNALQGKGGHLVTVNDYLAKRDSEWMGPIYSFLELTVGLIQHDSSYEDRRQAYNSDVTYGTNNEFGFDYLRDHMALGPEQIVQKELYYAIVDEVDSILVDEARTPLIISGPSEESTSMYYTAKKVADNLIEGVDFEGDEKMKTIDPKEEGMHKIEKMLHNDNLYDEKFTEEEMVNVDAIQTLREQNQKMKAHINQALKARQYFNKDVDYIVKDGEVIIVDEFTGRLMFGRRYSDGLHQAIEAKEGLAVKSESQTLATITFQNYFRLYKKLAGMTGTALTEKDEFKEIYNLDVYAIPTNEPVIRNDRPDVVFKTESAKFRAIVKKIKELYVKGEPVLVGTRSVEKSERISTMLKKENIPHNVLNAKYHEKEAMIIKDAGQYKMVTIATNMAGRGVDIKLGSGITDLDGLFILATERHEARRIDNQLRGRSGRQGDPGESQFYVSLEDDLMRIFGGDTIKRVLTTLKISEDEPIEHPLLSRTIEGAQKKVEAYNFSIRKNLLDYDNVLEKQRELIYSERDKIFRQESVKNEVIEMLKDVIEKIFLAHYPENEEIEEQNIIELENALSQVFNRKIKFDINSISNSSKEHILNDVLENAIKIYEEKEQYIGTELMRKVEKYVLLRMIDSNWKDHLYAMDDLKEGIGLRAYGQQDPLMAYQVEGHDLFDNMMARIEEDTVKTILRIEIQKEETKQNKKEEEKPKEDGQETSISKEERQKRRQLEKKLKKKRKL